MTKQKAPGPEFTGEYYHLRNKSNQFSTISFRKQKQMELLFNSFYETCITLIPKTDKEITRKGKLQTNIRKSPQQNIRRLDPTIQKKMYTS